MRGAWIVNAGVLTLVGSLMVTPTMSAEGKKPKLNVVVGASVKTDKGHKIVRSTKLAGVARRAQGGKKVLDCEGYAYLGQQLLSATCSSK